MAQRQKTMARRRDGGFTIVELLSTMMILGLLLAIVMPNLGALVPGARLRGSGNRIRSELEWARSEARIQGKRMAVEFDLDRAIWRLVYPPEQRLTRDEDESSLAERPDVWLELEDDVKFVGAGDGKAGLAQKGLYRVVFDEYGFTGDQVVILSLDSEPQRTWTLRIHGLSGRADVVESETGEKPLPPVLGEGAF